MEQEPACPFDTSAYTGIPDAQKTARALDIPELIKELDALYAENDLPAADRLIDGALERATAAGDWRSRLSLLSERLGLVRRTMDREKALAAIREARELIEEHAMGRTVSGATVLLNAATTMKCFGNAEGSLPLFEHVLTVYSENLDPNDYRFAGLYNNMALSCEDTGAFEKAEAFFGRALAVLEKLPDTNNDIAVTWCNLAELYYARDCEDERVSACMENAGDQLLDPALKHDGYFAFTAGKCLPLFDAFGFFYYVSRLRKILEESNGIS